MNACILVEIEWKNCKLLLDCGATAMAALNRFEADANEIDMIFISHLHGDHYAGLPFFLMNARFLKRIKPLYIYGPAGIEKRVKDTMELFFTDSTKNELPFSIHYHELMSPVEIFEGIGLAPYEVLHKSGAPSLAFRLKADGKILGYSGDAEWSPALIDAALDSDLFICECYSYEKNIKNHLNFQTLDEKRRELKARRIVLTHLGPEMLAMRELIPDSYTVAEDGLEIVL